MKILYVGMKYDYGDPARGLSFEHCNLYQPLVAMGHDVVAFDFMSLYQQRGRREMNRALLETVRTEEPDLMFTVLFEDELDPATVDVISHETPTVTLNWFCDDHWRFETFSSRWAPHFNWVVTTATSAVPKYERIGYRHAIKSQWGCNDFTYRKLDLPLVYDVSFVGQPHGNRRQVIEAIRAAGIEVYARGHGWEAGRLSQDEMIGIFNQSRINLNLPNAASKPLTPGDLRRAKALKPIRSLAYRTGLSRIGPRVARLRRSTHPSPQLDTGMPEQIKARNFEVPGCGGFLLTGPADDLGRYYEPGREIALFSSVDDMIDKIRYYLAHEDERSAIAARGYERTIADHTYRARFDEIFAAVGLSAATSESAFA